MSPGIRDGGERQEEGRGLSGFALRYLRYLSDLKMITNRVERSKGCDCDEENPLSISRHDLSRHEDEEHDFWFGYTGRSGREQLG